MNIDTLLLVNIEWKLPDRYLSPDVWCCDLSQDVGGLTGQAWCPGSHGERDSQRVFLGCWRGLWAVLGGERGKVDFKTCLLDIC